MRVHLGTDHAGYELKESLKKMLIAGGYDVIDHGADSFDAGDDYPDFIIPAAQAVAMDLGSMGIILGGSGQGEAMAANRVPRVRAAVYYGGDTKIVQMGREHNDANILSIGARFASQVEAENAVKIFLETPFSKDERHVRRINKFN